MLRFTWFGHLTEISQLRGMDMFREVALLAITTPIYAVVIGAEMVLSYIKNKHYYTTKGTLANVYLSALNFGLDFLLRTFCLSFLSFFFEHGTGIWLSNSLVYWVLLVLFEDFMYYWLHRIDHYCRFFWAVHVTHHSSEEFNLTVGFRSSVFQPLYRFFYFIPIALLGFKGEDVMFVYAATQIWGILIHTKAIDKLGFLELFMSTPSHHRVHHASNVHYLDKNMGMLLIIWDKLFGTFAEEDKHYEAIRYGLTKNIETYHPLKMVFHEWIAIGRDIKKSPNWYHKFMYVFGPPGWSHDGSTHTSAQLRSMEKAKN